MTGHPASVAVLARDVTALVESFASHTNVHALAVEAAAVRDSAQREADLVTEIARQLVPLIRQADDPDRYPEAAGERDALVRRLRESSRRMSLALVDPTVERLDRSPLVRHEVGDCQWCAGYEAGVWDGVGAVEKASEPAP